MTKSNKRKKKRTLSSPDNTGILPEKRNTPVVKSANTSAHKLETVSTSTMSVPSPGYIQPMNMAHIANLNSYQTPNGTFFTPPHQQFVNNASSIPTYPPVSSPSQTQQYSDNFQQTVIERLNSMDKSLKKLDSIESQLSTLSQKMASMETRVLTIEKKLSETSKNVTELETSRAMESQIYDEIQAKQKDIDRTLKSERDRVKTLQSEYDKLKSVSEEVIDLQARSMRDNLLFFGFDEKKSVEERKAENCAETILNFCKDDLKILDAVTSIKIERAHRVGKYDNSKTRPIVVKFSHYPDKLKIKQRVFRDLPPESSYRVSDQFPKAIQDRRKLLIPTLIKAREDNKTASLSYDKLIINGKSYTVDTVASAGYS